MPKDKSFYVGQKAFIRKGDSILVLNDPIAGLDFPGGKIQEGETDFTEALKREVREETGLEIESGTHSVPGITSLCLHTEMPARKSILLVFDANIFREKSN